MFERSSCEQSSLMPSMPSDEASDGVDHKLFRRGASSKRGPAQCFFCQSLGSEISAVANAASKRAAKCAAIFFGLPRKGFNGCAQNAAAKMRRGAGGDSFVCLSAVVHAVVKKNAARLVASR